MFQAVQGYLQGPSRSIILRHRCSNYHKMGESRVSTSVCHVLLAGSSVWTCHTLHKSGHIQWAYGTLGLYFAKSCIGAIKYGRSSGHRIMSWYNYLELFCSALAVPFITSDLFKLMGYSNNLSVLHAISGLLLLTGVIVGRLAVMCDSVGVFVMANLLSMFFGGLWYGNFWAMAAAVSYSVNGYIIKSQGTVGSVPSINLELISLCFFNYFIFKALTDA